MPDEDLAGDLQGTGAQTGGDGTQEPTFNDSLPEEFRAENSLKDINSLEDLTKSYVHAQKKLGERVIPGDEASEEEWGSFFGKVRPKDISGYDFGIDEKTLPEKDQKYWTDVRNLFHSAGVSKRQAKLLADGYDKIIIDVAQANAEFAKQQFADFNQKALELWGDKKDAKIDLAKKIIAENIPESMSAHLERIDNDSMIILAATINAISDKYIKEDNLLGTQTGSASSVSSLREEAKSLNAELVKAQNANDQRKISELMPKVQEIYKKVVLAEKTN